MPTESSWNALTAPIPQPPGVSIGHPGMPAVQVDSSDLTLVVGPTRLGTTAHDVRGRIQVDSPQALQESFMGTPFNVSDNPLGLIPSTLFTPTPGKVIGIDTGWAQLLQIASTLGAIGV